MCTNNRHVVYAVSQYVTGGNELKQEQKMTWEEIYSSLPIQSKMIIDIAEAYKVDLTELANLQVQKQENDTHFNEVNYGTENH